MGYLSGGQRAAGPTMSALAALILKAAAVRA
jgi:hypothetical protein